PGNTRASTYSKQTGSPRNPDWPRGDRLPPGWLGAFQINLIHRFEWTGPVFMRIGNPERQAIPLSRGNLAFASVESSKLDRSRSRIAARHLEDHTLVPAQIPAADADRERVRCHQSLLQFSVHWCISALHWVPANRYMC